MRRIVVTKRTHHYRCAFIVIFFYLIYIFTTVRPSKKSQKNYTLASHQTCTGSFSKCSESFPQSFKLSRRLVHLQGWMFTGKYEQLMIRHRRVCNITCVCQFAFHNSISNNPLRMANEPETGLHMCRCLGSAYVPFAGINGEIC